MLLISSHLVDFILLLTHAASTTNNIFAILGCRQKSQRTSEVVTKSIWQSECCAVRGNEKNTKVHKGCKDL